MEQQKTFNFNLPSPYQTEMAELARRQRMAETLQQQAAEPVQKFGYGGIEVPISPLSGLAKALNSFTARQIEKDVLKEQKDLGEKYRADQMGDVTRLVDMLSSRQATPEINTGGEYYSPAVASKAAGTIEPSAIGQLRTPEMQNFALQQYLSQLAPKAPIKISAGEALVNPSTFAEVYKAPDKADWSSPIREQLPDGSIVTVMYDKVSGNRRIIDTGGAKPAVSADTEARLKQEKEISDRAFNNLSENQRRQLQNEAARIGISAQELFFNTGLSAGVPAGARPSMAPAVAPAAPAPVTPAAPLPTPARAPSLVQPPVSAAPAQTAAPVPAPMAGMTPKTYQQFLADQAKPHTPTEDQAKAAGFANRMLQANDVIEKLNFQPTRTGNIISAIPGSNFLLSSERQQAEQAQRNFINAILRRESGAAIAPSEFESAAKQYFPQPGDQPEVLEQKRQNRALAIQGLQQGAGLNYKPFVPQSASTTSGQIKFLGFK